ncbi:MAG: terpene cyclase/mutase family protein [Kiritimatiellae bacterium]|nr:terpene cyclase/mutase family protein [Kiritimatiellia bacterium]
MRNLMDLLVHVPLKEQWRRIRVGLRAPKDTGEYRYAKDALVCMFGPTTISMFSSVLVALCALFVDVEGGAREFAISYEVNIVEPTTTKLDDLKIEEAKVEEFKPPEPQDLKDMQNLDPNLAPGVASEITTPGPPQEFSSGDTGQGVGVGGDMDTPVVPFAVVMTRSPVIMKGLYGNRTKGGREVALRAYGGGGGGIGLGVTEGAVMRALRWLKKNQQADGSWKNCKPAMTAMAILTYLAHGETPASEEFGPTVEKAIKWMVSNQEQSGLFKGRDGNNYTQPIASYALCEAYGMMKLPLLKTAAEKAVDILIKGQHASGGWNYNCNAEDRDDTSYMGWCAQALKAAKMAGLENEGLNEAMKKAIAGFKKNYHANGTFGYTGPTTGYTGLTGVGVLCLQLLGAARDPECRNAVLWLEKSATFDWDAPWLTSPIYYWYYVTQTKFHCGGDIWNKWNKQFSIQLVKNQQIEKEAIDGPKGKKYDIGYWEPPSGIKGFTDGPVMDTCLCTLQLEVYYRYLPTFKPPVQEGEDKEADSGDIEIKIAPAK